VVTVSDNGIGLPDGFDVEHTSSLGLSIVRDLVTGQLHGSIDMRRGEGTDVRLSIPVQEDPI